MTNTSKFILNIVFWPSTQLLVGAAVLWIPQRFFERDSVITRTHPFEQSLRVYRSLSTQRWKKLLPDWGKWMGGERKQVHPYDPKDVRRFLVSTRRSEVAHWVQLSSVVICWYWNPIWASTIMTLYAVTANLPCIVAQRYNRLLLMQRRRASNQSVLINLHASSSHSNL